ncbi:cation-efflux pump [Fundidesulfovibrio butyratiphilus]
METKQSHQTADREKHLAALSSVAAAVFLTGMKLVVGLATNSLGILSEAAHSGLDLLAAGVTYFAVRYSSRPADSRHPYGHGKIENLSALVETVLLLCTCAFIVHEAVVRLVFRPEAVEITWWSFAVMAVSVVVDVSRSKMLSRMAEKYNSQALKADALHFSTDVWASAVVIFGLGCLASARFLPHGSLARDALERADAVAALGVCVIVVWVSVKLGRDAVDALLDGGSEALADRVRGAVAALPGVAGVGQVRARYSGPAAFVDLDLEVPRASSFAQAHQSAAQAEAAVRVLAPGADVVVRLVPVEGDETLFETVRALAATHHTAVHGIVLRRADSGLRLEMHVEVPRRLSLAQAHDMVSGFERDLCAALGTDLKIVSHIEPVADDACPAESDGPEAGGEAAVRRSLGRLVSRMAEVSDLHELNVHRVDGKYCVSFHCRMAPGLSIEEAHAAAQRLEELARANIDDLGRVIIHVEPEIPGAREAGPD